MKLIDHRELLKFTASERNLSGVYECRAANGVGEPAKAEIDVNIICKYTRTNNKYIEYVPVLCKLTSTVWG